jgi:RNA-dependent RNA polymerase
MTVCIANKPHADKLLVKDGAFCLGVIDETATLRGHSYVTEVDPSARQRRDLLPQIFLQVPDHENKGQYRVVTGLCVIGRNPSLHPGDLRVVEAVDIPALRHLKDVVVFPLQGDRDVPSMCSGGDLDGDDYFVFWNQGLIPENSKWNEPPMNYTAPKPEVKDHVKIEDLISFFVVYMKNDSLPTIAMAHRAHADRLDGHAKHQKCKRNPNKDWEDKVDMCTGLKLAELHSTAVDYVKSGIPAQMPKSLQPNLWPHWTDRKSKKGEYKSTFILGQLYDKVRRVDFQPEYDRPFDSRILDCYELEKETLNKARRVKTRYDNAVRRLMGQREIKTEFEVWSGFILSRPSVGSDYKHSEHTGREMRLLRDTFRQECINEAGGRIMDVLGPFAAAMYQVTQEEVRIALHECQGRMKHQNVPLISFPWLFPTELGRIAHGRNAEPISGHYAPASATKQAIKPRKVNQRLDMAEIEAMDYVRTAEGVVTHRGEPLFLFGSGLEEDIDYEDDGGGIFLGSEAPEVANESFANKEDSSLPSRPIQTLSRGSVADDQGEEAAPVAASIPAPDLKSSNAYQMKDLGMATAGQSGLANGSQESNDASPARFTVNGSVHDGAVMDESPAGHGNEFQGQSLHDVAVGRGKAASAPNGHLSGESESEGEVGVAEEVVLVMAPESVLNRAVRLFGGDD